MTDCLWPVFALHLHRIAESKEEAVPRHIEMRLGRDNTGAGAAGPVPIESLPSIVRTLSAQDSGQWIQRYLFV